MQISNEPFQRNCRRFSTLHEGNAFSMNEMCVDDMLKTFNYCSVKCMQLKRAQHAMQRRIEMHTTLSNEEVNSLALNFHSGVISTRRRTFSTNILSR